MKKTDNKVKTAKQTKPNKAASAAAKPVSASAEKPAPAAGLVKCKVCGKLFLPKAVNGKYCSDECYRKAKAKRDRKRRLADRVPAVKLAEAQTKDKSKTETAAKPKATVKPVKTVAAKPSKPSKPEDNAKPTCRSANEEKGVAKSVCGKAFVVIPVDGDAVKSARTELLIRDFTGILEKMTDLFVNLLNW